MSRLFSLRSFGSSLPMALGFAAATTFGYHQFYRSPSSIVSLEPSTSSSPPTYGKMNSSSFVPLTVKSVIPNVAHKTSIVNLDLGGESSSSLPVSSFVLTKIVGVDGKDVSRPYTPLYFEGPKEGELSLLVKRYEGGIMSSHLQNLKPGDTVDVKGPINKLPYQVNKYDTIGLVAGGTGITPMLQILSYSLAAPEDKTKFVIIFGNQSPKDILLQGELQAIADDFPDRVKLIFTVDKAPEESRWKGHVGVITKELLEKNLPKPSEKDFVYVCGPAPMYKAISGSKAPDYSQGELSGALAELGWKKENVFKLSSVC